MDSRSHPCKALVDQEVEKRSQLVVQEQVEVGKLVEVGVAQEQVKVGVVHELVEVEVLE